MAHLYCKIGDKQTAEIWVTKSIELEREDSKSL